MTAWWPMMLAGLAAAFYGFRRWRASEAGALSGDRLMLRMPVIGRILHNAALGRFARSMSMALRSGVPVPQAIHLIAQAVGNAFMSRRLERVRTGIERGESLHRACAAAGVFNPLVLQMISVGEESGTLDEMLEHMADLYAHDVDYDLKRLSSAIEPILIVLLGGMVLVLALGVFLPIWDLGQAAMRRGA
jgi:MSHA biogenesis protein MshG